MGNSYVAETTVDGGTYKTMTFGGAIELVGTIWWPEGGDPTVIAVDPYNPDYSLGDLHQAHVNSHNKPEVECRRCKHPVRFGPIVTAGYYAYCPWHNEDLDEGETQPRVY